MQILIQCIWLRVWKYTFLTSSRQYQGPYFEEQGSLHLCSQRIGSMSSSFHCMEASGHAQFLVKLNRHIQKEEPVMCSWEAFFYNKSEHFYHSGTKQICKMSQGQTLERAATMEIPWPQTKVLETKKGSGVQATMGMDKRMEWAL